MRTAGLGFVLAFAAACTGRDATPVATCAQLSDHLIKLGKREAQTVFTTDREAMTRECEAKNLTDVQRRCLLRSKSFAAASKCRPAKP